MIKKRIEIDQTAATIICEDEYIDHVLNGITEAREIIEAYIGDNPDFELYLEPLEPKENAPEIIGRMCRSSKIARVGPMAAVAGAIADAGVRNAVAVGSRHCIVENGGDIAMILEHPINVGILDRLESELVPAIRIEPTSGIIMGLCTSSGQFGHSISLGCADAVTVMAEDVILADAVATALGNELKDADSIENVLESFAEINEIIWAIVMMHGTIGTLGDPPNLQYRKIEKNDVTVHSQFTGGLSIGDES